MANKVEFGISNLYVGTYTVGTTGTVTMGTPYHQAGAVSFSPEEQSESNTFYADNGLADELGGILALQKAIKTHSVYAFLMDGVDTKPEKKEEAKHDHDRKTGDGSEAGNSY